MQTKATAPGRPAVRTAAEDRVVQRSISWLRPSRPITTLTEDVQQGLAYFQLLVSDDDVLIARALVHDPIAATSRGGYPLARTPNVSVMNRRRRAARLWVNAILAGDLGRETLRNLTHVWLPQLAGSGPDPRRAVTFGRRCVEFLRGSLTACVMAETCDNLLRHAKAIHALEAVLAGHLLAIRSVTRVAAI